MTKIAHTSPDLPAPAGPYSHVVAAGPCVYTAGFGPQHPNSGAVAEGIEAQTERVINNVEIALRTVGLSLEAVVKTTVHLQHPERDFEGYNAVYRRLFPEPYPARTTVGSTLTGILVEIDAVAVRPDSMIMEDYDALRVGVASLPTEPCAQVPRQWRRARTSARPRLDLRPSDVAARQRERLACRTL